MRGLIYVLCGLVGGAAGAFLMDALREDAPQRAAEARSRSESGDVEALRDEVRSLRAQVAALARGSRGTQPDAPSDGAGGEPCPVRRPTGTDNAGGDAEQGGGASQSIEAMVRGLAGKPFDNDASNRLFAWTMQNTDKIKDLVKALEKEIKERPNDPELRVALATAWVGELTNNTTPGPQQGIVWGRALAAYDAALKIEPEHWQARFGKAFGNSMAPEFLGMRPQAIREFEDLRALQEQRAPQPEFSATYFRLGTLYKDAGNLEKAREVWEQGTKLFPDNAQLKGALEVITKK